MNKDFTNSKLLIIHICIGEPEIDCIQPTIIDTNNDNPDVLKPQKYSANYYNIDNDYSAIIGDISLGMVS